MPSRQQLLDRIEELEVENCDLKSAIGRRNFAYEVVRNSMRKASVDGERDVYVVPKRTFHRWQNVITNAGMDEPDPELDAAMERAGAPYVTDERRESPVIKYQNIRKFGAGRQTLMKFILATLVLAGSAAMAGAL